jgi:SAM-dependent methyltransferase
MERSEIASVVTSVVTSSITFRPVVLMTNTSLSDHWESGEPYERYMGRWSRRLAPAFLEWLGVPDGRRWLDVGCGTGAMIAAILDRCAPLTVTGVEPSDGFRATAMRTLPADVALLPGSATSIPLADDSVDAVVASLVMNFVDDQPGALREMLRVCVSGGVIGACVWDYERMELIDHFWQASRAPDPGAAAHDEAVRFPLCREGALAELFRDAGLGHVASWSTTIATPFASFDDYWQPFLGGQGPAPAYLKSLDESHRERLRDRLQSRLAEHTRADGSIELHARALGVRGIVM